MCLSRFAMGVNLISFLVASQCELQPRHSTDKESSQRTEMSRSINNQQDSMNLSFYDTVMADSNSMAYGYISDTQRLRRDVSVSKDDDDSNESETETSSGFEKQELGWSKINDEVDMVIPMVLAHLRNLSIEYLQLPDMKESISVNPFFITYEAGLFLTNGIVYNVAGIQRNGDAYMTYENKSFISRFYLIIKKLQFEYNFLLKLMALEGYGKVIGSLDDTIVYAELAVNVSKLRLKLHDFRIVSFRNINVQLDQRRIIRELTGVILSPITNLFRDRITTSISDGLKDQMQIVIDDFSDEDPLQLRPFTRKLIASLTGKILF